MSNNQREAAKTTATQLEPEAITVDGRTSHGLAFWIRVWWPVAVGIGIICLESTEMMGADHTSGPLRFLSQFFFGPISDTGWENIHHYIRKSGHFFGYGTLCLTWLRAWRMSFPQFRFAGDAMLAILGTAVIASGDELHQSLLTNRGASPLDVLLDCCGAATTTFLTWLILHWVRPKSLYS